MPMAHDAEDFVDDWIDHNIEGEPAVSKDGTDSRPAQYAENCFAAAAEAGLLKAEIEDVFGDLDGYMAVAIDICAYQDHEVEHLIARIL